MDKFMKVVGFIILMLLCLFVATACVVGWLGLLHLAFGFPS